ncbi:MAG: GatB/YqeY domain-containing protein [Flavobacteriales bacterium]|nr:GatB/YqeY domain-containing protein [Flavobacteriales bacterium]
MSLITTIDQDIKAAMLARESQKLTALRAIKAALLLARTEKGPAHEPDEAEEVRILQKLLKQRQEAAAIYTEQGREDLAANEHAEAAFISKYLPEQMSEEDVLKQLKEIVAKSNATEMKDMGKVMGIASKVFAGKADNKMVSDLLRTLLS